LLNAEKAADPTPFLIVPAIPAFSAPNGLVMACHITGIHDVNRSTTLPDDDYGLVRSWAESVAVLGLRGIIFHNNLSEKTVNLHTNEGISFVHIPYDYRFNPNVYRYLVYRDFLERYADQVEYVFVTDVSDVVVVQNPFLDPYFVEQPDALFCGDEPKLLDNEWMYNHATHLRNRIDDFAAYELTFGSSALLNCGIIGAKMPVFKDFIHKLAAIHVQFNQDNTTQYTGDMGAFNYLARTQFDAQLRFGAPVNTVFKAFEGDRLDCWFRHK
jgi:hypothetical protein